MDRNLIIFIKNPRKGFVKTRLANTIGDEKALAVYIQLLEKCQLETSKVAVNRYLYYSEEVEENDMWNKSEFQKRAQITGDLGERIVSAIEGVYKEAKAPLIIMGGDCYDLTTQIIEQAFEELQKNDLVIGPANDGGYYLLGINQPDSNLFEGIDWSTDRVFQQTIDKAKYKKMSYTILEELIDLDTFEDLEKSGFPKL